MSLLRYFVLRRGQIKGNEKGSRLSDQGTIRGHSKGSDRSSLWNCRVVIARNAYENGKNSLPRAGEGSHS
ncbi:hypothetical protein [Azospirillum argentinense]